METFQGRSLRPGIAIAAAARIHEDYGVLSLDPQRLRQLGERLRRFGAESPEAEFVVLIGARVGAGFITTPLPGLEYVGVAAGTVTGDSSSITCPMVEGLPDAFPESVEENDIIIIDGDRGRVHVAPDATTLARYQAPFRRSGRIFLGSAHLTARTASEDRPVSVVARVSRLADATDAIEAGADGLWIPGDNDFLGPEEGYQSPSEQTKALEKVTDFAGGKPVFLQIPIERLSLTALARAAASGTIHCIVEDLTLGDGLRERLREIEAVLEEEAVAFGTVRFEAGIDTALERTLPETLEGFSGVWVIDDLGTARMDRLLPLAGQVRHARRSFTLRLPARDWATALPEALDLQAERVVTTISDVEAVKDAIRMS